MASVIRSVEARLFRVPLREVLVDAAHGDHSHFELVTVTLATEDGREGTGYASFTAHSNNSCTGVEVMGRVISWVKGSGCFVSEICAPSHFSPSPICGGSFITNPALNL